MTSVGGKKEKKPGGGATPMGKLMSPWAMGKKKERNGFTKGEATKFSLKRGNILPAKEKEEKPKMLGGVKWGGV